MLITVYALIGDDVRILSFEKQDDVVFMWLNVITFTMFTLELLLSSIGIQGYFGSFFFVLDFISTVSIVLDIEPLFQAILQIDGRSEAESQAYDLNGYINTCASVA